MARARRTTVVPIKDRRLLRLQEGADYYGLGIISFRKWAEHVGAVRKIGNCWTADKWILDEDLRNRGRMDECKAPTNGHTDR